MIDINAYISDPPLWLMQVYTSPWALIDELDNTISKELLLLSDQYHVQDNVAVHKDAVIEQGVVFKGKIIISPFCYVSANAYLRGPVFLGNAVNIGPGSEIKQSIILDNSAVAHFNYIGNSIIGKNVNFEAGSICANHYNERENKNILIKIDNNIIDTKINKFGALVGDHSKIGANAVLSPGTILQKGSIVKRLELIEQVNLST